MTDSRTAHPKIVSRDEWLTARKQLLAKEKELTRARDAVNAERRRLPMVRIDKDYRFDGPDGEVGLRDLFDGRRQLIVYHFMFDPEWDKGCPGCTRFVDALGDLSMLGERDTSFALISRAPLAKLEAYKAQRGWSWPWVSSFGSDFNYDFHVTLDEKVAPVEYDYRPKAEMIAKKVPNPTEGEEHGLSVFFHLGDDVFHTYSAYARGTETLTDAYSLLDTTPYGRQEDFEDSPPGWPQQPTYGQRPTAPPVIQLGANNVLGRADAVANVAVKDVEKARNFYEGTLGLKQVGAEGEELIVFKSGSTTINVYRSQYAGTNRATAVTWAVEDVASVVRALKAKGVAFEHYDMPGMTRKGDVHVGGDMQVAWFKDPDGNILNIASR